MTENLWAGRDALVLRAVVELVDAEPGRKLRRPAIVEATGLPDEDVRRSLAALIREDPPLITHISTEESAVPAIVTGVTAEAYRRVGAWPSAVNVVDRLVEGLRGAAERELDDSRKSRLREIASDLAGAFRSVATEVAASAIAKSTGLG